MIIIDVIESARKNNHLIGDEKMILDHVALSNKIDLGLYDDITKLVKKGAYEDIVRPPFDLCFFELNNGEGDAVGYLVIVEDTPDKSFDCILFEMYFDGNTLISSKFGISIKSKLNKEGVYSSLVVKIGNTRPNKDDENMLEELLNRSELVFKLFRVMACSNVEIINNIKYKNVRAGSKKKGKLPLYSYKTLHIKANDTSIRNNAEAIGTHASPRLHLRRGHIRKLSNGITVWVQSCMVGTKDNGIVEKDYKVCT